MAQKQTKLMTQQEIDQAMVKKLITNGFPNDQAQKILSLAKPLSRGQKVTIPPDVNNFAVTQTSKILSNILNNPKDAKMILATELGPKSSLPAIHLPPVLIRPDRYAYEVDIVGKDGKTKTFSVELTTRIPAGYATIPENTRAGRLYTLLRDNPGAIYAIKSPDGKTVCRQKVQDPGIMSQKLVKNDAEMDKYLDSFEPSYREAFQRFMMDSKDEAVAVRFTSRLKEGS